MYHVLNIYFTRIIYELIKVPTYVIFVKKYPKAFINCKIPIGNPKQKETNILIGYHTSLDNTISQVKTLG